MFLPDPCSAPCLPFRPAARRPAAVFGAPVELVLLPERAARRGRAGAPRPPFAASIAERIVAEEGFWRDAGLVVTPNRYPFAERQLLLWREPAAREHDLELLQALFAWVDAIDGTGMFNSIGAAASIARAHAHVTAERLPFLPAIAQLPATGDHLPAVPGVEYVHKQLPFVLLGVRGEAQARARALHALQLRRMTPSANVVVSDGVAWICPRSLVETPAPDFPFALGAAEIWGRWCFLEAEPFERATGAELERALLAAGVAAAPR